MTCARRCLCNSEETQCLQGEGSFVCHSAAHSVQAHSFDLALTLLICAHRGNPSDMTRGRESECGTELDGLSSALALVHLLKMFYVLPSFAVQGGPASREPQFPG